MVRISFASGAHRGRSQRALARGHRFGLTRSLDYRLAISEKARAQLRELPREQRRLIGQRIEVLRHGLQGDIKKLAATKNRYRLRAGDYRVLFVLESDLIAIYSVRNRKEAYD